MADQIPPERRFALRVQPERPDQPWRAALENEQHERLEFDSPLQLARYLANLECDGLEHTQRGLR